MFFKVFSFENLVVLSMQLVLNYCKFLQAFLQFKFLQPLVTDLRDKMTGISLYGTVTDIKRGQNFSRTTFSMRIKETTGSIWAKLHFVNSW